MSLPIAGGWTMWSLKASSNPTQSLMHPQKASCHHQQQEGFTVCFGDGCPQMVASTLHRHLGVSLPEKPSCINGQHGAGPTAPQVPARLPSSCEQLGAEEDKERRGHPAVGTWLWVTGGKDLISLHSHTVQRAAAPQLAHRAQSKAKHGYGILCRADVHPRLPFSPTWNVKGKKQLGRVSKYMGKDGAWCLQTKKMPAHRSLPQPWCSARPGLPADSFSTFICDWF